MRSISPTTTQSHDLNPCPTTVISRWYHTGGHLDQPSSNNILLQDNDNNNIINIDVGLVTLVVVDGGVQNCC